MALDLSGFIVPEQKYEGLYKIADTLQTQAALEARQRQAALEAQKEAQKQAKAAQGAGFSYLDNLFEANKWGTGDVRTDSYLKSKLQDAKSQLSYAVQGGADMGTLRSMADNITSGISKERQNLQIINKNAEDLQKQYSNQVGVDAYALANAYKNHYLRDDKGNVKTNFSDIQVNDTDLPTIVNNSGAFNKDSFDEFVKGAGNTMSAYNYTEGVGKKTTSHALRTNAPNGFVIEKDINGQFKAVPQYEIATDNGAMHKIVGDAKEGDKEIRMVTDDVYNKFNNKQLNYLNQQAQLFITQSPTPPTPTQEYQFKKALAYYQLENSSKLHTKIERDDKNVNRFNINMPTSEAAQNKAEYAKALYNTLDNKDIDNRGYMDISDVVQGINTIGKIKPSEDTPVKYNPKDKKVLVVDSDGKEHEMSFDEFITTVTTNNTKDDRQVISLVGKYKGQGKSGTPSPTQTPTGEPWIIKAAQGKGAPKRLWEQ
jgi:hypothetical protein